MTATGATLVVLGLVAVTCLLGVVWFLSGTFPRPPLGTMNWRDVGLLLVTVVLVPFAYLGLPRPLVIACGAVIVTSIVSLTVRALAVPGQRAGATGVARGKTPRPVLTTAAWAIAVGLVVADVGLALVAGTDSTGWTVVNDLVMMLQAIGVAALWAQSGLRSRDLALLATGLTVYDITFTWLSPTMSDFISRAAELPFAPLIAWHAPPAGESGSPSQLVAIGLGDVLVLTLAPMVMRKAWGAGAGWSAVAFGLATVSLLFAASLAGFTHRVIPVMVLLGPVIVAQHGFWRWRRGQERTTREAAQLSDRRIGEVAGGTE